MHIPLYPSDVEFIVYIIDGKGPDGVHWTHKAAVPFWHMLCVLSFLKNKIHLWFMKFKK